MHKYCFSCIFAIVLVFAARLVCSQETRLSIFSFPLNSLHGLDTVNGKAEITTYRGRQAVHLVPVPDRRSPSDEILAVLTGHNFKDGTIEVEVAGSRCADAAA